MTEMSLTASVSNYIDGMEAARTVVHANRRVAVKAKIRRARNRRAI